MDRLSQLRGEAGGSGDSTFDTTSPPSEAFMSANENSSKYFSINDSTFDITPIKDVSLASTSADADRSVADGDELISNLSPIGKKELDSYKIGKQIEAANILSGGVDIFDGDDNSFDGDELVIDDNMEVEDKANNEAEVALHNPAEVAPNNQAEVALDNQAELAPNNQAEVALHNEAEVAPNNQAEVALHNQAEVAQDNQAEVPPANQAEVAPDNQVEVAPVENIAEPALVEPEANEANREMEVVLQIDGNNVNAVDIGNGLYLYREDGQHGLAAIQILDDDPQHSFKFLKVRDNAQGNLEVYEEIEIEVPREVPTKEGNLLDKNTPHVPTVDINKSISDPAPSTSKAEGKNNAPQNESIPSASGCQRKTDKKETSPESIPEVNLNGKMMKFSESRKSPVVGSFTPRTFHSTPKKKGKPLTKTMVDLQLDPNRQSDNVKKTIEVHTENLKQKPTELPAKEKSTAENVKSVDAIIVEKEVSTEKSDKVTDKEDVKKDNPKNEDELDQTESAKRESTGEIQKSKISTDKEKITIAKEPVIEDQNKASITSSSSKESIEVEIMSVKLDSVSSEKEVSLINNKDLSKPDKSVVSSPSTSKQENKTAISNSVTNKKLETASKPVLEQLTPVDLEIESAPIINKVVEKPTDNKIVVAGSTVKAAKPAVVEEIQNMTFKENVVKDEEKPSKIKILENISLNFPTTSGSNNKPSTVKEPMESSMKPDDDNNVIKFPLESFSEVSSTCTNLGSEESKEESITLYSIDTDESVSLISPSSTTKIRDDKVVLSDKISEVLTSISNLSNIQTQDAFVKNVKPSVSLPTIKEFTVQAKAKNEADSTSKLAEQINCPKLEKTKTAKTSDSQKSKEMKEPIPVTGPNLPEKAASSISVPKAKDTEKSAYCTSAPKEKVAAVENSTIIKLKPTIKESQSSLAPTVKSSGKVPISGIKPLTKTPEVIPTLHAKPTEKLSKSAVTQDAKTVQTASKPQEKTVVPASVPVVKPADKKYSAPIPLAKATDITSIPAEINQTENSSTTSNKTSKPDSHIPVASVANKPSSKHITVVASKVDPILKPVDNATGHKEIAKNNTLDKKPIVTKIETREIKEPIRKPNVELGLVNNNHATAVPFGKWTDAHRQEFVNKFKEVKAPPNTNSKQIKNSNDLNRRDVLQKIDSQRAQTIINAVAKGQDKISVKSETVFSSKVVSPTVETKTVSYSELPETKLKQASNKIITKEENSLKTTVSSTLPKSYATDVNAKTGSKTKPGSTVQTNVCKIEPTPKEQSTVGKIETAPKEQCTVSKIDPSRDQTTAVKTELALRDHTTVCKTETAPRDQNTASCYMASLIDKTIEDMISRVVPGKNADEPKQAILINSSEPDSDAQKPASSQDVSKLTVDDPVSLDDIEMKMNELHGIPFVERPPHELPKILKPEIKTYSKIDKKKSLSIVSKITNTTTEPKLVKDLDSEEEIIDHEPITGDLDLKKKTVPIKTSEEKKNVSEKSKGTVADKFASNKDPEIITETEFDKFARRNSITYENSLTVHFDHKEPQSVVQTIKEKDLAPKVNPKPEPTRNEVKSKLPIQTIRHPIQSDKSQDSTKHGSVAGDSSNKKYQSKIHSAYQSALTAKHQVSHPISIIEDKPVKVVFLESNIGFVPSQLNVQGQELSPTKKPAAEANTFITANNDSVDSGMAEIIDEIKQQDKTKIKHQRKQVLTPVEEPDLELIQPSDIGIQATFKKKRKVEDIKVKNVVPKKSYLLGRNTNMEDKIASTPLLVKDNTKDIINRREDITEHKDTASAIDNLVKAAELLENQAETENKSVSLNSTAQTNTPVKRGRGRPRKYPLPDGTVDDKSPSPQKKPRLIDAKPIKQDSISDEQDDDSSEEAMIRENWTMGKINENIVCPICNKLFRSENVVFKHVKHCTGVSPNRSESDKKSPHRARLSRESEDIDMDYEISSSEGKKDTPKERKSKDTAKSEANPDETKLDGDKYDVIVIEDTPIKEKLEKFSKETEKDPTKESKAKVSHRNKSLVCEFCGKTFRQQSYLTSHKLQHKKDLAKKKEKDAQDSNKSQVFSCEVCKKEFRKLHHLVQHRINHNPNTTPKRALRKSSSEQTDTKNLKEDSAVKQAEDASAGFRCEPCDKSFRKLHHLVEHRGTHDGINRQKPSAPAQPTVEKPPSPPQCQICKKTFRKLHHLIEHKEQHADTSSDKSDDKSIKSALSTKDIIHECSLCYMVFPNEHSLNKHFANCSKKKRQSKLLKDSAEIDSAKETENTNSVKKNDGVESDDVPTIIATEVIDDINNVAKEQDREEVKKIHVVENILEVENPVVTEVKHIEDEKVTPKEVPDKPLLKEEEDKSVELLSTSAKRDLAKLDLNKEKEKPVVPEKTKKIDHKEVKTQEIPKRKIVLKDKITPHVTKRQKSIEAPLIPVETTKPSVESSDDDEIRYMLNPNFKVLETSEGKTFMKVRARKRNSLQIERPNSNDHAKRRTSLQLPPKISRLKPKAIETKPKAAEPKPKVPEPNAKLTETKSKLIENKTPLAPPMKLKHMPKLSEAEAVLSTDSDDSDVKYSFPKTAPETSKSAPERMPKEIEKKVLRKSLVEKRKSLGGIAKRKTLGKGITVKHKENPPPPKPIKKRSLGVEHRCDCGELFSSAALLSRHTSLAHTPPRIRRRREPAPSPTPLDKHKPSKSKSDAPPSAVKPTRKPSVIKTNADDSRKSPKTKSPADSRKSLKPKSPADSRKSLKPKSPADSRKSLKPSQSEAKTAPKTRRAAAHSGVPLPEKVRKLMQKLMK